MKHGLLAISAVILMSIGACGCQQGARTHSELRAGDLGDPDVRDGYMDHCTVCHPAFRQGSDLNRNLLRSQGTEIRRRLNWATAGAKQMPPAGTPQRLALEQKPQLVQRMLEALGDQPQPPPTNLPLDRIRLPDGFKIRLYAKVPGARSLAVSPRGTVFVGTRGTGKVYAVRDSDGDFFGETVYVLAEGRDTPMGVALSDGDLYVSEFRRIVRYRGIEGRLEDAGDPEVVFDRLPGERRHGAKYMGIGPDKKIYVGLGAPCNICDRGDPFASIHRLNLDGSGFEPFVRGVRNTVGFDWHPSSKVLWFTDNGRDHLGDNQPPDELNRAPNVGWHYGYPYCHGNGIPDPELNGNRRCGQFSAPAQDLGAHVASLGMRFYTGQMFPAEYRNQIFIAEHGSWNRSKPIGYRISLVKLDGERAVSYETFAEGWLNADGSRWGRPVDVAMLPDGSLLVSSDYEDEAIYRISYEP